MSEFEQMYQDIDTLPEEAKIILLDFIKLLKKCYSKSEEERFVDMKQFRESLSFKGESLSQTVIKTRQEERRYLFCCDSK